MIQGTDLIDMNGRTELQTTFFKYLWTAAFVNLPYFKTQKITRHDSQWMVLFPWGIHSFGLIARYQSSDNAEEGCR